MKGERAQGFTIIETMLFLGISGLLVVGMLYGAGAAINTQRYKDALYSFMSYLQGEYDRVANVQNDRNEFIGCNAGAGSLTVSSSRVRLGTTDCMIVGRVLELDNTSGKLITARNVYASRDVSTSTSTGVQAIIDAGLFVDELDGVVDRYVPEWDTKVTRPRSTEAGNWRILIVRSPVSGGIHTFVSEATGTVASTVSAANKSELTACVDSQGLVLFGRRGVVVVKDAAGSAGVKEAPEGAC